MNYCNSHNLDVKTTKVDHPSGTDRVAEIARQLDVDIVVNIQADEPFVTQEQLSTVCDLLLQEDVYIATLKHKIKEVTELLI